MTNAVDSLRADHDAIHLALRSLRGLADHVADGRPFPQADCAYLLRFLREFVVGSHFRKESEWVLPALAIHGDDESVEQAGDMLRTQELLQSLLHSLVLFWEPVGELTAIERTGFAETALLFVQRAEAMLDAEELRLLPMAESQVPADDRLGWPAAFAELDGVRGPAALWLPRLREIAAHWAA
jgi:hemerythrin-like domain-containing protein